MTSKSVNRKANPKKKTTEIPAQKKFICTACGKSYDVAVRNFTRSRSPLFAGYGGYVNVCNDCLAILFDQYLEFFNEDKFVALERICQIFDWPYSKELAELVGGSTSNLPLGYAKRLSNPPANIGTTYADTIIKRSAVNFVDNKEAAAIVNEQTEEDAPQEIIDIFGYGFSVEEYKTLNILYKRFLDQRGELDAFGDTLIRDLCVMRIQQSRMLLSNDTDKYAKISKLYQDTLSSANIKMKKDPEQSEADPNQAWGMMVQEIEQYTPAEFYKDKELYSDFDKIKSYFERFILRPMRNLLADTKDMDAEYQIQPDEEA